MHGKDDAVYTRRDALACADFNLKLEQRRGDQSPKTKNTKKSARCKIDRDRQTTLTPPAEI